MIELATHEPLLIVTILALLVAAAGWMLERDRPATGKALRFGGYLGMLAAGLLLVGKLAYTAEKSDVDLLLHSRPELLVNGTETVVPMAADGHFWVTAKVNGEPQDFLIDTGASYTGMSRAFARKAGIAFDPSRLPKRMETANGMIVVSMGTAQNITFGGITVTNHDVAVPRDFDDDTFVIGMNLLSQLASWRVEGQRLILRPKA